MRLLLRDLLLTREPSKRLGSLWIRVCYFGHYLLVVKMIMKCLSVSLISRQIVPTSEDATKELSSLHPGHPARYVSTSTTDLFQA